MKTKAAIRQQIISQRKALTQEQRLQQSNQIINHLLQHSLYQSAQHIACYLSIKAEVDTQLLIEQVWQQAKRCYLPVLDKEAIAMEFALYQPTSVLTKNRYGIAEPVATKADMIAADQLNLVLLPLVAFDKLGNRLGMGAGYYDRAFHFKQYQLGIRPLLIGLAYDFQQVDILPGEQWDVRLNGVVTERGIKLFDELV